MGGLDGRHEGVKMLTGVSVVSIGGTATSTVIVCVEMEGKKAINYFGHGIVSTCSQRSLFCFSRS